MLWVSIHDLSLFFRYPYDPNETISVFECFAIWAVIVIIIVGIVETFAFVVFRSISVDDMNASSRLHLFAWTPSAEEKWYPLATIQGWRR